VCFDDKRASDVRLFFEVNLPLPRSYRRWLRRHIADRTLVPHVVEEGVGAGDRLEGSTHVDALLLCEQTGFAVLFEAKILSDCDSKVSFDVICNQLPRSIDVILDANPGLQAPLTQRRPERTCFALLTPVCCARRFPSPRDRCCGTGRNSSKDLAREGV
jgi:hypothetical protein